MIGCLCEDTMGWNKGKTIDLVALLEIEQAKQKQQQQAKKREELSALTTLRTLRSHKTYRSTKKIDPQFDLNSCRFYLNNGAGKDFTVHRQVVNEKAKKQNIAKKQHFLIIWNQPAIEYYEQVLQAFPELLVIGENDESNIEASIENLKKHFLCIDAEQQKDGFPPLNWNRKKRYCPK